MMLVSVSESNIDLGGAIIELRKHSDWLTKSHNIDNQYGPGTYSHISLSLNEERINFIK